MSTGILICGLNGAGKSTLGSALAARLGLHFIDNEALYFPKTDPRDPYAVSRSREEVARLLAREIAAHPNFVFASVKGDYGEDIQSAFRYAVLINTPKAVRMRRVRDRSFRRFGDRMLPGGDQYAREQAFFALVESRPEALVEEWARTLRCPVIRVDGTRPIAENVEFIARQLQGEALGSEHSENLSDEEDA